MIKGLYLITLSCFSLLEVHAKNIRQIDSALEKTTELYRACQLDKAISNSFEIIKWSQSINYDAGTCRGMMMIAESFSLQGEYKKSLKYIDKLEQYDRYLNTVAYEKWRAQRLEMQNNYLLGFHDLANKQFYRALSTISDEKDSLKKAIALISMYVSFMPQTHPNSDTQYYYFNQARIVVDGPAYKTEKQEYYFQNKAFVYTLLGEFYLKKKNFDSAKFFLTRVRQFPLLKYDLSRAYAHEALAKTFLFIKQYDSALHYRLLAFDIYSNNKVTEDICRASINISEVYASMGDTKKQRIYSKLYFSLKDSLNRTKNKGRDLALDNLHKTNESKISRSDAQHTMIVFITVALSIVVIFIGYLLFRKHKLAKDRLLTSKSHMLKLRNEELSTLQVKLDRITDIVEIEKKAIRKITMLEERQRLAQDLHDELSGSLAAIWHQANRFANDVKGNELQTKQLNTMRFGIKRIYDSIRNKSHLLYNDSLSSSCDLFEEVCLKIIRSVLPEDEYKAEIDIEPGVVQMLSQQNRINILVIIREAMINTLKHAKNATEVHLFLYVLDSKIILQIGDNGQGLGKNDKSKSGIGLDSMHKRVTSMGGALEIQKQEDGMVLKIVLNAIIEENSC